jgi:hypothetical protein
LRGRTFGEREARVLQAVHSAGCRLTEAEFNQHALKPLCKYLDMLGFPRNNVQEYFQTLQDADQTKQGVDIQEFLHGCMRLKGAPSKWDITSLAAGIDEVKKMQVDVLTKLYPMRQPLTLGKRAATPLETEEGLEHI